MRMALPSPDPSRCPVCGAGNRCAMVAAQATGQDQPPCWCTRLTIDPQVLAAIPPSAQGKACLCQACASRPSADGVAFRD